MRQVPPVTARVGYRVGLVVLVAALGLGGPAWSQRVAESVSQITLSMTSLGHIDPRIYGTNYVWDQMPASRLPDFASAMSRFAHYSLARYPGGWAGEFFDWQANRQLAEHLNRPTPAEAGPSPEAFIAAVPEASFTTPSVPAVRGERSAEDVASESAGLARRYGAKVHIWEIGNEWWLQRGGKNNPRTRAENLRAYAALVARVAPAMKAANPSIDIYATIDWLVPGDTATLRDLVGPAAWSKVDGIAIHTYLEPGDPNMDTGQLPSRLQEIRQLSGKEKIYDSEWSVTNTHPQDDFGIHNANWTLLALRDLGRLHVTAAAYWPVVLNVPRIALASQDYKFPFATGLMFGWMSTYYRGEALGTGGDIPAAAAKNGKQVTVIAATQGKGKRIVRIPLAGTGLSRVVSSEVIYCEHPELLDGSWKARFAQFSPLPASVVRSDGGRQSVEFEINPGTPGRATDAEIVRVTLE